MPALLRLTGWSALAAGLVHLTQFLVLGIGPALNEPEFPTPAQSAANYWFGLVGGGTFTLIGLAYLLFFSAATSLVWRDATGTGVVWRRAMQSAAVIGIAGWLLAGATNIARRGFNATGIGQVAPALHGDRLASAFPELTERERQVLAGIAHGLPNSAIATRLGVSNKTVANYISIVLTKLRVPDKERAAELARRRGAEELG